MRDFFVKHETLIRGIVFLLCVSAAVVVPLLHIEKYQEVKTQGVELKFHCGGADPYSPFLGRYITVRLNPNQFRTGKQPEVKTYARRAVYVKFRTGKNGFAEVESCSFTKPADMTGVWYMPSVYVNNSTSKGKQETMFSFWNYPVDRYYLNEKQAKKADKLSLRQNDMTAFVRLKDGSGIIDRLIIKGMSAEKYLSDASGK